MTTTGNKSALVTGATGFIGSYLAKRLVKEGWSVHLIVRLTSDLRPIQSILKKVTIHRHDGSMERMLEIIDKAKPDVVFHLASMFMARHNPIDVMKLIESNVLFASQLVEAMTCFGVNCLVNTGTSWQHFENRDYSPVNLYAATKQAFEAILQYYGETSNLKIITLKLFDTYGPNDPRQKLFALLRRVVKEKSPLAMSPGEQFIDLVYIDDVIDAFVLSADRLLKGKVDSAEEYAVSSGCIIRLKDLVDMYGRVIGEKLQIEWGGLPYRDREVMVPWNKGATLPGWKPKIGLEKGIAMMEMSHCGSLRE